MITNEAELVKEVEKVGEDDPNRVRGFSVIERRGQKVGFLKLVFFRTCMTLTVRGKKQSLRSRRSRQQLHMPQTFLLSVFDDG